MTSYTFVQLGRRIVVDRAGQVLRAEIVDHSGWQEATPIHRSVAAAGVEADFTPLMALAVKAKRFDERLYEAVERIAHDGAGENLGLFATLEGLRTRLAEGSRMRGLFEAARHLAGEELPQGSNGMSARRWLAPFARDAKQSKPLGAYAESEERKRLFRHDRILQSKLKQEEAAEVRAVLAGEAGLLSAYRGYLEVMTRLTGPLAVPSIEDASARETAVLPGSDSAERRLIEELFGDAPVPPSFELGRELIERIRDGRLETMPSAKEGWYAHQFHAIAALLSPEEQGLRVGPRYRKELEDAFQALFALNRETHVKQLASAVAAAPMIVPRVTIEPVPGFYARMAQSYRYVREALAEVLGELVLRSCKFAKGAQGGPALWDGLLDMEMLFLGAEALSREELGQSLPASRERDMARARFGAWQSASTQDEDLQFDLRVAAPVWFDEQRNTVHLCATVGVETRPLEFDYVETPNVRVVGASPSRSPSKPSFHSIKRPILSTITLECDVREAPTREEFRKICDEHQRPAGIRAALEAR
ncbi:hypothetical protein LVJ94_14610 [Pendulispora rubella]|uniref:Uncharacterized protein n=1 Tax=Pendulispora rubella TaxID=2741070 RepID=A0ABZ2LC28_9BACT